MATNYVATTDMDALLPTPVWQGLFTDQGGAYDSTEFIRASEFASILIRSAADNAGYDVGDTTTDDLIILAATVSVLHIAFGRSKRQMPESLTLLLANVPEALRVGELAPPSLDPSADDAVGGVRFSDSSSTTTDGKPSVFKDLRKVY